MTPEAQDMLESLLQHLLPTPAVSPPKATLIPSELELGFYRYGGLDTELPVAHHTREEPTRESGRRDWSTAVCFSCSKLGHAASQCRVLDIFFLFLPPGQRGLEAVLL